jgi:exopolysaccharide biosynthesis protein
VKYKILLICVPILLALGCSHAPLDLPDGTVIVNNTNPKHTIVEFNAACPAGPSHAAQNLDKFDSSTAKKQGFVVEDGKTYYFSSEAERDRIMQDYAANSRY